MKENHFQSNLIKEIKSIFQGCVVLKNDANYIQGFPDILILFNDRWAALEVKRSANASLRPNQEYYVDYLDSMSYASIIYPENKEEIIDELREAFGPSWGSRLSQRF